MGSLALFYSMLGSDAWGRAKYYTRERLHLAARQRREQNRRELRCARGASGPWSLLQQQLDYSGISLKFPGFTVEYWCLGNLLSAALAMGIGMLGTGGVKWGMLIMLVLFLLQVLAVEIGKHRTYRVFHGELTKFLDFLGNYSVTSSEVSGIFRQIARYMEPPLGKLLEQCSTEAQTTGDVSLALLAMAERIEHPKFKELLRNMEIGLRYSADFSALVQSSRRSIREYERGRAQRQGLLREAMINMVILLVMAAVILLTVDGLIEVSVRQLLFHTGVGWLTMSVVGIILVFFVIRLRRAGE